MAELIEGDLIVERVSPAAIVRQAPRIARITLQLIQSSDPLLLRVDGNQIVVGDGQAVYHVTGWDAIGSCLIAERRRN